MSKINFSKEEMQTYNLALDLARNDFAVSDKLTKKDYENKLRDSINNDMLGGLTLYQALRRNKNTVFEIVEEIVNTAIRENVFDSPFVNAFVEIKDRGLGDRTDFYAEGGLLTVSRFAGNHWDTNRQALNIGDTVTLPAEWIYCHVYEDLERFLLGITPLEKMVDKVYASINKYIQDRIYAQFNGVANAVPTDFVATGNTEAAVGELCDKVQAAGGYANLTVAGTKAALRKLAGIIPDKMFASSQKEAKASTGSIGEWEGNSLMVIPQTLASGTFDLALSDSDLFILGGDVKPIKLEFYGDSRTKSDTEGLRNNDQSIDFQVQTKMGMGLVLPPAFGKFTLQ